MGMAVYINSDDFYWFNLLYVGISMFYVLLLTVLVYVPVHAVRKRKIITFIYFINTVCSLSDEAFRSSKTPSSFPLEGSSNTEQIEPLL